MGRLEDLPLAKAIEMLYKTTSNQQDAFRHKKSTATNLFRVFSNTPKLSDVITHHSKANDSNILHRYASLYKSAFQKTDKENKNQEASISNEIINIADKLHTF